MLSVWGQVGKRDETNSRKSYIPPQMRQVCFNTEYNQNATSWTKSFLEMNVSQTSCSLIPVCCRCVSKLNGNLSQTAIFWIHVAYHLCLVTDSGRMGSAFRTLSRLLQLLQMQSPGNQRGLGGCPPLRMTLPLECKFTSSFQSLKPYLHKHLMRKSSAAVSWRALATV